MNKVLHVKAVLLSFLSAVLLIISQPPFFNLPFVGFIALVPLIVASRLFLQTPLFILTLVFGLSFGVITYSWYVDIFSFVLGLFLILAVSLWHTKLISYGIKLERRMSSIWKIFAIPLVYASFEFLQRQIPFINEWWFVPYAKSQWGFPPALGLLSVTGISGVTFIMILANSAISDILLNFITKQKQKMISVVALFVVVSSLVFGYFQTKIDQIKTIKVAAISDMANTISSQESEGYFVQDKDISKKILEKNIKLTKQIASQKPDFVLWSENEFVSVDDEEILGQIIAFSKEFSFYIILDTFLKQNGKLYDSALSISPDGKVDVSKKTHLFSGEIDAGFSPSNEKPKAIETKFGKIGVGVCFDFHFDDVVRALVKQGAKVMFFPTDDDMKQNRFFPYFHQSDAIFRAIEYNIPLISANTNGASIIVNSNGKIEKISDINKESAIIGMVNLKNKITLYEKFGQWFGYLIVFIFGVVIFRRKIL